MSMLRRLFACPLGLCLLGYATGGSALDISENPSVVIVSGITTLGPEMSSDNSGTSQDDRVLQLAGEDAAAFVASAGQLRTARLERALCLLRERGAQGSDLTLAAALLARLPG